MRKLITIAVVLSIALTVTASAANYFYDHFFAFKDQIIAPLPAPKNCSPVKGITMALDEESVLQLAYLCADDTVVIRTDMRPGSGTAVGSVSQDIKLHLDAVNGGWAYECGHVIQTVSVTLNGRVQDLTTNFNRGQRQDVAAAFGNVCAEMGASGIGFYLDTTGLASGTYPMTMQVVDDSGHRSPVSNTLMVVVR
jgi:hypothetical protein